MGFLDGLTPRKPEPIVTTAKKPSWLEQAIATAQLKAQYGDEMGIERERTGGTLPAVTTTADRPSSWLEQKLALDALPANADFGNKKDHNPYRPVAPSDGTDEAISDIKDVVGMSPAWPFLVAGELGHKLGEHDAGGAGIQAALAAIPIVATKVPLLGKLAGKTASKAIQNLRHINPEEALEAARRGEHLIQHPTTGQFVGAPRGTTLMEHIEELRRNFDAILDEGGQYDVGPLADWYKRTQQGIRDIAGPSASRQRQTAGQWAATSPQADPDVNLGFAQKAHNAFTAGKPAKIVRTGATADKINSAMASGEDIKQGLKTDPFFRNMIPEEIRTFLDQDRSVNDIWHLRNWGFKTPKGKPWNSGATPQMHAFVDAETRLAADRANARALGGKTDWTSAEIQAMPWILSKAKGLAKRYPKRYSNFNEALADAAKAYPDYFNKYTANATYETIPGRGTGHRPDLETAPAEVRQSFSADPARQWTDENGRDIIYDAMGMNQQATKDATGFFRASPGAPLETNPAHVARPMVSFAPKGAGMDDPSSAMLNAGEHLRAYSDMQNAGAHHIRIPKKSGNTAFVPMDRPTSPEEMQALADAVEPRGFGISDTGGGVTISPSFGSGVGAPANMRELGAALKKGLGNDIAASLPDATDIERIAIDGNYIPTGMDQSVGKGRATRKLLKTLTNKNAPSLFDRLSASESLRQKWQRLLDANLADQAAGLTVRQDYLNALAALSKGGPSALRDALKAGVALPAIGALAVQGKKRDE